MHPQLIVFDLAGTTVEDNQDVQRILMESFRKVGIQISLAEAAAVMGIPKPVAIEQLLREHASYQSLLVEEIHKDFRSHMVKFYESDPLVGEKAGVTETFQYFQSKGICIVVDTGFDRQTTDALLSRMGWLRKGLVNGSVTSDEVEHGRPYPDMIYQAMKIAGVDDPGLVAKVGDTASDLGQGTAAGCGWVIGITTGAYTTEQLKMFPHTHLIAQIPDLRAIFGL
ncbi:MAG: HAD hydrolase-like protein [Cyclobacteriaceae bacterium]|nr:HAD hydrolase-like protein [Cyclobacteriaceae bacterium]